MRGSERPCETSSSGVDLARPLHYTRGMSKLQDYVVVRTYSAGVHIGTLASHDGSEVELHDARRIWRWRGANTLHEVALRGIDSVYSRVSEAVSSIVLTEAIEIIACTEDARSNLDVARWGA